MGQYLPFPPLQVLRLGVGLKNWKGKTNRGLITSQSIVWTAVAFPHGTSAGARRWLALHKCSNGSCLDASHWEAPARETLRDHHRVCLQSAYKAAHVLRCRVGRVDVWTMHGLCPPAASRAGPASMLMTPSYSVPMDPIFLVVLLVWFSPG